MPTRPSRINVARILHVSDDFTSSGIDEVMTASATQEAKTAARGTAPTIVGFDNDDLIDDVLYIAYDALTALQYVVVVDNTGAEIKVSPVFDPSGRFFSIDFATIAPITGTWQLAVWITSGPDPYASGVQGSDASDFIRARGESLLSLTTPDILLPLYIPPLDRRFVCRDLNFIVTETVGVSVAPKITLDYMGGYKLLDDVEMPIKLSRQRYSYDLKSDTDIIVPSGKLIRVRVSTPGVATGVYTASVNIAGYLI